MHGLTGGSWKRSTRPTTATEKNYPEGNPRVTRLHAYSRSTATAPAPDPPVHPGGLHPGPGHSLLGQPVAQRGDPRCGRGERPGVLHPEPASHARPRRRGPARSRPPSRDAHPARRSARPEHRRPPPSRAVARRPVDQESEVRARSSRTGCLRTSTPYSYASSWHQACSTSDQGDGPEILIRLRGRGWLGRELARGSGWL